MAHDHERSVDDMTDVELAAERARLEAEIAGLASPRGRPSRAILWTIVAAMTAVVVVAGIGIGVAVTPRAVSDGARTAVDAYVAAIVEGRLDDASALVPGSGVNASFASNAAKGRTAAPSDVAVAGLAPFDRPALREAPANGDEVVRITYSVDGTRATHDVRVAPGATPDTAWTVRDPLTVEVQVQAEVIGDVAIGEARLTFTIDDVRRQGSGNGAPLSLEPRTVTLYPGAYAIAGDYGSYFDSSSATVVAVPGAHGDASASANGPIGGSAASASSALAIVSATPTATLTAELTEGVARGTERCFNTATAASNLPFDRDACGTITGNALPSGITSRVTATATVTPPTVQLRGTIGFDASGGRAVGTAVQTSALSGSSETTAFDTEVAFTGYVGVVGGSLQIWVDTGLF